MHLYQTHKEELLFTKYLLSAAELLWALMYSRSVSQGQSTGVLKEHVACCFKNAARLKENLVTADFH